MTLGCRYAGYITCTSYEKVDGAVTRVDADFHTFDGRKPPKVWSRWALHLLWLLMNRTRET